MPRNKPSEPDQPAQKVYNFELVLSVETTKALLEMIGQPQIPETQRIGGLAKGLLEKVADGGFLMESPEIDRLVEATGIARPECGEDLVEICGRATGMQEGRFVIPVTVDPAYKEYLEQPARIQGITLAQLLQDAFDYIMDNDVLGYMVTSGTPRVMRMGDPDYRALKELLGEDFDNGTALAKLCKKMLGGPLAEEDTVAELTEAPQ